MSNRQALIDLLCIPCATCGKPSDSNVWVGQFIDGVFVNQCGACWTAEHGDVVFDSVETKAQKQAKQAGQLPLFAHSE